MNILKWVECSSGWALSVVLALGLCGPMYAAAEPGPIPHNAGQPAPLASSPADVDQINTWMADYFAPRFTVDSGLLSGGLLAEAQALSQAHTLRMRELLVQWTRETGSAKTAFTRLANAFALWGLDSLGPAHDARWLLALQSPGACYRGERFNASELESRLQGLQSLPPDGLALALADERNLLARWGQPDQALNAMQPLTPFADYDDWKRTSLSTLTPELALQRQLAIWLLQPKPAATPGGVFMPPGLSCAANQMALRAALATVDSTLASEVLMRWRESQKMTVAALVWAPIPETHNSSAKSLAYPRLAVHFGVQGTVKVVAWADAAGTAPRAAVARRDLLVDGLLPGQRPAAFESLLDAASIARIQETVAGRVVEPGQLLEQLIVWKIE